MTTRFDENKFTKPSRLDVASKHKVLREFQIIKTKLSDIVQERIKPSGPEPEPPLILKKHIFENPDILTQSEKQLYNGFGSAIVGDLEPDEYVSGDRPETRVSTQKSVRQKAVKSVHENLWDISNFSSINNKLPVYPRSNKGFVSFDQQTARPDLNRADVNEARFLNLNKFPSSLTTTKHTPAVEFRKQLPRSYNNKFFANVNMSEPVEFERRPSTQPIYQFSLSTLTRSGQGMTKKQVQQTTEDSHHAQQPEVVKVQHERQINKVDLSKVFSISKQLPRSPGAFDVQKRITQSQGQKRMIETLPGYFFNMSGRNGAASHHAKTLQDRQYPEADFSNPKSTFNDRKLFRVNPETNQLYGQAKPHKQAPTFVQLLQKGNYMVSDKTNESRKRPWHVLTKKEALAAQESNSDDDYV